MLSSHDLFLIRPDQPEIRSIIESCADASKPAQPLEIDYIEVVKEVKKRREYRRFKLTYRQRLNDYERWEIYFRVNEIKRIPYKQGRGRTVRMYELVDQFGVEITTLRRVWRDQKKRLEVNPDAASSYFKTVHEVGSILESTSK